MNVEAPTPAKQPWWKRPLRLAFFLLTLFAAIAILAPYGVALLLEKRLGDELTRKFGVPCRFDAMRFGWLSGVTTSGLEIGNARGFDASHPALRIESAHIEFDVARLFSGAFAFAVETQGVEVFVDEDAQGKTNFEALSEAYEQESLRDGTKSAERDADVQLDWRGGESALPDQFERIAFRLSIADSSFELRRDGRLLESLRSLDLSIEKDAGSTSVRSRMDATAMPLLQGQAEATVRFDVEGDARTRSGSVTARIAHCELARWRPLLESTLPEGSLTQFAGAVNGVLEARFDTTRKQDEPDVATSGDLTFDGLRLGGPLLSGFEITAAHGAIRPTGRVASRPLLRDRASLDEAIAKSSLDLGVEATDLTIARDGAAIDSFVAAKLAVNKAMGAPRLRALLEVEGSATAADGKRASALCTLESDTMTKFTRGLVQLHGIDLARYRRFASAYVSSQDLSRAEGFLSGRVDFESDFGSARRLDLNGEVVVDAPHFTGELFQGAEVRSQRFVLKPSIRALVPDIDGVDRIDLGKTSLDLGFASLTSLDETTRKERGIVDGGACSFRADLVALAKLGGPFTRLSGTTGEATGLLLLPKELFEGGIDSALAQLRDPAKVRFEAEVRGLSCAYKGLRLLDVTANAKLEHGVLSAASADGTRLNAGPLRIGLRADANQPQVPFELALTWKGGALEGETAELLRYLVPLLAGTTGKAADFRSVCDLNMNLQGFALRQGEESLLEWLDRWTASGDVVLSNGRLVPAPSLQPMLAMLEQPQELAVDRLASAFTMRQGAISHRAMKWISKGKDYGLSGTVRLDGQMEMSVDLTSVLQQHKDGSAIAGYLGKDPLTASIGGTVDAPKLVAPDLGKLLQQALQAAPRQLLEQRGQDLLQKGLDRLFGDKKKKDEPNKKQ